MAHIKSVAICERHQKGMLKKRPLAFNIIIRTEEIIVGE